MLRGVLFDVDFTLARPGPELGPQGYVRAGARHGLTLEPARYEAARDAAVVDLRRHPELEHDDEIWFSFTERIVRGMGGDADAAHDCAVEITRVWARHENFELYDDGTDAAHDCSVEITRGWERHENFELYDDVPDALATLRAAGLSIGLVSTSSRDVHAFARHHRLDVDAGISSFHHGRTKPHASIFRAVLELLEGDPAETAMVGETIADDIEGSRAVGMQAILLDRDGLHPEFDPRITGLKELLPTLG